MSDTKPLTAPQLATLHVIGYLRWEREWYETFETRRAKLLRTIARLLDQMSGEPDMVPALRYFLFGGQTVILEDIAAVRPDLLSLVIIYNAGGRLGLGPWYIHVDEMLVSGESLVRNLLAGRQDASKHGIKLVPVAYTPDANLRSAQLPQILRGFGISAAFVRHDDPTTTTPFHWEGADGNNVLVIGHEIPPAWGGGPVRDIKSSVDLQQKSRPDGPFLWMMNCNDIETDPVEILADFETRTGLPAVQSDLPDFLRVLRRGLTDRLHLLARGDLNPAGESTTFGALSARLYLKQQHAQLESQLLYAIEPWMALALTHGRVSQGDNLKGLLNYSWRLLHQNQTAVCLGGLGSDEVHATNEMRFRQVKDVNAALVTGVLRALPGKIHQPVIGARPGLESASTRTTYVVVWNPHNWPLKQVVQVDLRLPPGMHPFRLRTPGSDEEQVFGWTPGGGYGEISGRLIFLADVPAVGYSAYTLELSATPLETRHQSNTGGGQTIASVSGEILTATSGGLTWQTDDFIIEDLLRFFDSGDAGDAFSYCPPASDVIVQAALVEGVQVESSPLYERLIIRHRMRLATGLRADRTRERGLKPLELVTTATFYDHMPGIYFHSMFENTVGDHRLRAHLRTGLSASSILTNGVFGLSEHPSSGLYAAQTLCAVPGDRMATVLLARGLPEVEAFEEDGQTTLALTLLRSFGWLSRDDLRIRPGTLGPMIPTPGAQCLRDISAEYGVMTLPPGDKSALLRAVHEYDAPLQAYQYDSRPERPRRSYLSIISDRGSGADSDGRGAILTAFKPPTRGSGWIIRLLNPTDTTAEVFVTPFLRAEHAQLLNLAEESLQFLEMDGNGRITVQIEPHQLITLRLTFAD